MKRPTFDAVLAARLSRRTVVTGAAATVGLAACAHVPTQRASSAAAPSFTSIAPQNTDAFTIADGYRYNIVARWGDSLVTGTPDFDTRRLAAGTWLDADAVGRAGTPVRHERRRRGLFSADVRVARRAASSA